MGNSLYGIAVSALNAAQIGLSTTGHNIANANTTGYSKQAITQTTQAPQPQGTGFIGRGVQITTITRTYDEFLNRQVQAATSQDGYLSTLNSHLSDLDNLLADPSAGFSPSLQDFFAGVQTVANDPKSAPARQSLLGLSESMVTKLQTINNRLSTLRNDINGEIQASVANINSVTSQIAQLNDQIILIKGQASNQPPNDLLDKRDQLVTDLNKYVKGTVVKQSDGSYNIFIGNGQNLVVGNQSFTLGAVPAPDDQQRLDVAYQQFGATAVIPSNLLSGGSLGALLEYRNNTLQTTQNAIGRVALALASNVNSQNRLGQDLNGQIGGNFFKMALETTRREFGLGDGTQSLSATIVTTDVPFIESDFNVRADAATGDYIITRLTDNQQARIPALTADTGLVAPGPGQPAFGVNFSLSGPLRPGEQVSVSFAPSAPVVPNSANTGNAQIQVSIVDPSKLTTSDYEFTYVGPDYQVVRKSDNTLFAISASRWNTPPVEIDGLRFQYNSGKLNAGDRFDVRPTRDIANNISVAIVDTAKIAAAVAIRASADTFAVVGSKTPTTAGTITPMTIAVDAQGGVAAKRVNLVFTSNTSYDIVDANTNAKLVTNQTLDPSGVVSYNGWSVTIAGSSTGDQYTVDPRRNTGSGQIAMGSINGSSINANLRDPVAIVFDSPTTYRLLDPATGNPLPDPATGLPPAASFAYTSGGDISYNGWKTQISGIPATGDTFLVQNNAGGVADARNILLMGQLQTKNVISGTTNYQSAYSKVVADVGVKTNQAKTNQSAQASLLSQMQAKQKDNSGVNLDEEASNLLIFQQAYMASSRTIQIAQKAFEEILSIGR